jgi:alpha-beta hydrolase superfamily lysophospholipase
MSVRAVPPSAGGALLIGLLAMMPQAVAATGRAVALTAPDGTPLAAMIYEGAPRPAPAVVLVHMLGRSKDEWNAVALRLQEAGLTVLTVDLRGHGGSGGSRTSLSAMTTDVRAAVEWLSAHASVRPGAIAIVGASLGASLSALAAADLATVRGVGMISPALDYRGLRLDPALNKLGRRPLWLVASTEDPYALRTIRELAVAEGSREQRLSAARAHGTALFDADPDLTPALVDWLRRTLVF